MWVEISTLFQILQDVHRLFSHPPLTPHPNPPPRLGGENLKAGGHPGFQYLKKKVLSPCCVGEYFQLYLSWEKIR